MHHNALKPLLKLTMKLFVVPEQEKEDFGLFGSSKKRAYGNSNALLFMVARNTRVLLSFV